MLVAEQPSGTARRAVDRTLVRVVEKTPVADGVVTLTLAAPDGGRLPDWAPGAHVDLTLANGLTRQYSLCGDRWDAHTYRVGVLLEPASRGGSAHVHRELEPGSLVGLGGPRNNFPLVPAASYLFVAGGIGITPLLPMVAQAQRLDADWRLLYVGRRRSSMAFLDELAPYGDRVVVAPRDERGPVDLAGFLGAPRPGTPVYACGPARLLAGLADACAAWPARTLPTERFTAVAAGAPALATSFEVELHRTGRTVTVTPDVSVLEAVAAAGVEVLSSCRQGTCGTCETGVLAGRPDHRDALLDDDERAAGDCMYPCVSRSRDARLVLDL